MNVTIGARVVKTGIAVALALFAAGVLGLGGVTIAGVAAIFAIQPSVYRSWRHMLEQVQTNTLGALLALGVSLVVPVNEIVVGVTCIVVILITLALRMETTVALTLVTTIVVLEAGGDWVYALERFATILVGIAAAFLVNAVIMPPNHRKQFLDGYRESLGTLSLLLRTAVSDELKERESKTLRGKLSESLRRLDERYGMLEEEWRKWKKFRPQPGRDLVVQKQMIRAMSVGQLVLDAVQAHFFPHRTDGSADRAFGERLEELIRYHEYIILKYEGKMKRSDQPYVRIGELTDTLLRERIAASAGMTADTAPGTGGGTVPLVVVASAIYEYGRQLRRLDKLVGRVHAGEKK